ncbi:MAG: hypothetical protein NTW95_03335, partial [Candidatus Aminicenantes bacterium]|nr:hypothetical protein [Candidatus Aminicenantes bacterium]
VHLHRMRLYRGMDRERQRFEALQDHGIAGDCRARLTVDGERLTVYGKNKIPNTKKTKTILL